MKKARSKRKKITFNRRGRIQLAIIVLVLLMGLFFTASLFIKQEKLDPYLAPFPEALAQCCDTGDGEACVPQTGDGQEITYEGRRYGLLRSGTNFVEGNVHLADTGLTDPQGDPIIKNTSDVDNNNSPTTTQAYNQYCRQNTNDDTFFKTAPSEADIVLLKQGIVSIPDLIYLLQTYCISTPNDQMIFVCRENCASSSCSTNAPGSCYGSESTVYDIYFRIDDYNASGIPEFVKNCDKSKLPTPNPNSTNFPEQEIVYQKDTIDAPDLQLDDFYIKQEIGSIYVPWVSPFCKPAIYLYPEKPTTINVKVKPVGPMTYTIPLYPEDGWTVRAFPNGDIFYQNKLYDYLYYEAEIPDSKIQEPEEGYVVEYEKMENLLNSLLPKLGLNIKESQQFKKYWLKALPQSPYYSVKVILESNIDEIAPLTFSVKPDSIKRIALSFKPLDEKISSPEPTIIPFKRSGFTVIEWGGLFKRNEKYNFSCFM